jgi:hypothetical protein
MNNNKRNVFSVLLNRIINKSNFNKVLIIFSVGFVSRVLVGCFFNVNVFLDYFNFIYILYYIFFSVFIVLVHEFVDYFSFSFSSIIYTSFVEFIGYIVRMFGLMNFRIFSIRLGDIKLSIIKGASNRTLNSKSIKIYSVLDRNNEIKFYGKTILGEKACSRYRPVISSPLSNSPITPTNIGVQLEMNPIREIKFSGKTNSSLPSASFNHSATSQKVSAGDLAYQEKNNNIIRYKEEFKVFYTTYRESIKLSDYELESLSIKIAEAYHKGEDIYHLLPNEDHIYLYDKFVGTKEEEIEMNERKKYIEMYKRNSK